MRTVIALNPNGNLVKLGTANPKDLISELFRMRFPFAVIAPLPEIDPRD